jgi:hypothetical protein
VSVLYVYKKTSNRKRCMRACVASGYVRPIPACSSIKKNDIAVYAKVSTVKKKVLVCVDG